jgi:hypothetical protein
LASNQFHDTYLGPVEDIVARRKFMRLCDWSLRTEEDGQAEVEIGQAVEEHCACYLSNSKGLVGELVGLFPTDDQIDTCNTKCDATFRTALSDLYTNNIYYRKTTRHRRSKLQVRSSRSLLGTPSDRQILNMGRRQHKTRKLIPHTADRGTRD